MRKFFVILSLICIALTSHAQRDFNFINFSSKDGLSSNSVNAILKDRYGYLWFGTEDGLNKFDGINFTVYRYNAGDSTSVGSNTITALCEDKSGNLWVGTSNTLSLYDRKKDAFINYEIVQNSPVRSLCCDHQGNLWMGSYSGLYLFDPRTGQTKHYFAKPGVAGQLSSNTVLTVFEDSHHRVWVGSNGGLHQFVRENDQFISYSQSSDAKSSPDSSVRCIAEDRSGNIWLGLNNGGLSMLMPDGKSFRAYRNHPNDINTISSDRVFVLAPDHTGKLWVGTEEGINILDITTENFTRIESNPRNKYSLKGKSVRCLLVDKNGISWIGTQQGGVNKFDQNLAFFNLRQSNALDPFGLSFPIVTSFVENPSGDIYIGTDGGGLNLYRRKTGLFEHPELPVNDKSNALSIMAMERIGNELWIGTFRHGLFVLNMVSGKLKHFEAGPDPENLSNNEIFAIKQDSKGNIWVGTNGNGLNVYDPKTGIFRRYDKNRPGAIDNLPLNGFIRTIEEDRFGNIWIGSQGSGIAVFDPKSGTFRVLNHTNNSLPSNSVLNMHIDRNGAIWVGTAGGGLGLYNENTHNFISYSEPEGLSNAFIYKILEDDSGKLWVSTNKGISSFDKKSGRFKNYSYQNGLQRSTFAMGAGLKSSTGELFFGGLEGFNFFNPLTLRSNKNVPSLLFTDLKISNRSVVPGKDAAIKEHISIAKEIRLDYKQNFSLDFVTLDYTAPQESRYSYKLEGFDRDWNLVGAQHSAVYTNLDPGEYTFRVKAKSDDELWQTPETAIKIYVKPPFWRTTYAYILYVLAFASLIAFVRYRGIQKLKYKFALEQERLQVKQLIEQERKEAERQHEFDQLKIKFLTNLSHEFRTPISLIVGPVERMLRHEASKEKSEQLSLVRRNARRLLNLVNQLLDFRKLEENELKLNCTEGDLVSFVKDIGDSFKDISERKHINFIFTSSVSHFYTAFDRDKIERILFNLLSNAFKFTQADGKIGLKIEHEPGGDIRIIIADTGMGISHDLQEKIFERFFQGEGNASILNQGSGIGLSITWEFVKLHGGTIHVESIPGKGSTFVVQLPCKPIAPTFEGVAFLSGIAKGDSPVKNPKTDEIAAYEKPTILLIEDHEDFRNYLTSQLTAYYKIVEASDGKQGWQKALATHPQVIVSDINMPGMDGIMLCRKLKSDKRTRHIPIILLTALTGDANQLRGLNTGANDYLSKPFNFEILHLKIRNLLNLNLDLKNVYSKQLKVVTPEIQVQSEDEKLLLKITLYIEANLDSPDLSVEDLSKHVYMSRGSLYNKIISLTGETPVEFIRSIKLNKAAALLENSDMKISEIGYAAGFTTPNYFARAFKAKFNISPTEYASLKRKSS